MPKGIWLAAKAPGAAAWTFDNVFTGPWSSYTDNFKMLVDHVGGVHFTYTLTGKYALDSELRYARKSSTGWETQAVATGYIDKHLLAIDSARNPYITYWNLGYGTIEYAYRSGSKWQARRLVDMIAEDKQRFPVPIAIDARGHLNMAYFDSQKHDLNVVTILNPSLRQ